MNDKVTPFKKQKPDYSALLKSELMQAQPSPDAPTPERYRQLGVDEVDVYENNPRTTEHAEYENIKAAFLTSGIDTVMLQVTRRPGSDRYVLAFGANTRLRIIKDLWAETGDRRFEAVRCIEVPWGGEIWLQTNHLIENTNRNDMCFWDTAKAFVDLHARMEAELGVQLPHKEFLEQCKSRGSIINRTAYVFYSFAVATFQQCRCKKTLNRLVIEQIKPRFSVYETIARLAKTPNESAIISGIEAFDSLCPDRFDIKQLLASTDSAVAESLGMSLVRFSGVLEILKSEPKATWERVLQRLDWREKSPAALPVNAQTDATCAPAAPKPAIHPEAPNTFGEPSRFALRLTAAQAATQPAAFWDMSYPDADRLDAPAQLATIWQLASFICVESRMPEVLKPLDEGVGFFVEPDPAITNPNARQLWSLLAMLSGQFYPGIYKRMPASSAWCQMLNGERPDALSWIESAVETPQSAWGRMIYGYAPYGTPSWINYRERTVAVGATSAAYARLMVACLELLEGAPERFAHISPSADGAPKVIGNGLKPAVTP